MKEKKSGTSYRIKTRSGLQSEGEKILLKWVEIIIVSVLLAVLIYLLFLSPADTQNREDYILLVAIETVIVLVAIFLNLRGKYLISSNLFIIAGILGPWWSAFMDPTVLSGNLLPLAYTAIPILFSAFFSPVFVTGVVGVVQVTILAVFIYRGGFDLSHGASSLFFFVVFMFGFSMIFNIQNRNHRITIADQLEELEQLAVKDPLTGLNNRRFLLQFLEKEIARLRRLNSTISILLLDIDNFKLLNDNCGHSDGDAVIIAVADSLKNHFRESDIICRYGGDEFLIIMSGTNAEIARDRSASIQKSIAQESFENECVLARKVTLSIGIASFPRHGETVDALIKAADAALYRAKAQGKNCIEVA